MAVALYAAGVSQRKAAEVMGLLLGHRYSHETISAMTEEVLQAVEAFRRRPLPEEMAFVYLDGLYLKLLREGEGVVREVVYVALGVTPSGERRVLGYWLLPAESALGWEGVLGELWQRGLRRVLLFITDGLPGLPEAIRRVYPQAEWQRCVVHGVRWSLGQVRARDRTLLAEDLRRVYGAESRAEALEALEALREAWGSRYPGVVALWAGDSGAFLRFYGYPKALWPYLRSTNLMERFIREIRRGTKVRGQAEGLSCPQVSQRGGGVQAPVPGSRASARILGRRGKKGGGRSEGSRGSRRRGRCWRRCFRSGMPPVHKRLHIHLDTTSLRDIVEVLRRHRVYLWALPLILATVALIYGFLIAEPTYASTATLSVAPVQVQAQLEQRIQVQQSMPIAFEGLKALALSEETVGEVWEALRKEGKLPTRWQDRGSLRGIERMMRDLKVKDSSPKLQAANPNQVPPIVASLTVQAPDPQVAAKAANLWVEAVKRRVNAIPLARLEASLKALEEQVTPAEKAYREAQARWEAFNKTTTLPQDKAELDAKTQERVGLDTELAGLERDLAAVQGRIQATLAEMRRQEAIVPIGTPPEQLAVINKRLQEAQASLKAETERARQAYLAAAKALEAFRVKDRTAQWQDELKQLSSRLADVGVRLAQILTEQASKEASLKEVEQALAGEPKALDLVREVVADPVVATAVAKGDLSALAGLRLKVQEVNPAYAPLLAQAVGLRSQIGSLKAEEKALLKEQEAISQRIASLKQLLAAQEREKEAVTLEYATKKAAYEAFRSRYDQIASLTAQDLTFDNPNPEFQRLRSALIDAQAEEARLSARRAALLARINQVEARLGLLKDRVAKAQVEQDTVNQALDLAKNAYLALAQKRTDLQIQIASNQEAWASILAPAYPVYEKVAPKRGLLLALAVALGLMLGVMAAFVAEALRPKEPAPQVG